jgi:hypothetical protein
VDTEAFLKEQGALLDYSEELERDLKAALEASSRSPANGDPVSVFSVGPASCDPRK